MLSRFRTSALCALLAFAVPAVTWAASPAPLKVMSFNVRTPADTDTGKRWEDRRDAMVKVIQQAHPAVIGTQELVLEQANYLAEHLPAEQLGKAEVLAGAAEQVFLDAFQGQQVDQGVEYLGHFGILEKGGRTGAPCYVFRRQRSSNRDYCRQSSRCRR